ncbi:MAG: DUF4349 domain-containing protein [Lachnospiraceae bacterium]|nr:DUF4349 domain-containing protein [Lachnospiraceae bacterium]
MKKIRVRTGSLLLAMLLSIGLVFTGCGSAGNGDYAKDAAYEEAESATADYDYEEAAAEEAYDEGFDSAGISGEEDVSDGNGKEESVQGESGTEQKLIRTVDLVLQTKEYENTVAYIKKSITDFGGYIQGCSVYDNGLETSGAREASFVACIPAKNANEFIDKTGKTGKITSQNETVENVTLEYIDVESRVKSLKIEHEKLEELSKKAENISDLTKLEDKLMEVRAELQSFESQRRYLENKVNYTTINIEVEEVIHYEEAVPVKMSTGQRIVKGMKDNAYKVYNGFKEFAVAVLTHLPQLITYLVFLAIAIVVVRYVRKLWKRKNGKHVIDEKTEATKNEENKRV